MRSILAGLMLLASTVTLAAPKPAGLPDFLADYEPIEAVAPGHELLLYGMGMAQSTRFAMDDLNLVPAYANLLPGPKRWGKIGNAFEQREYVTTYLIPEFKKRQENFSRAKKFLVELKRHEERDRNRRADLSPYDLQRDIFYFYMPTDFSSGSTENETSYGGQLGYQALNPAISEEKQIPWWLTTTVSDRGHFQYKLTLSPSLRTMFREEPIWLVRGRDTDDAAFEFKPDSLEQAKHLEDLRARDKLYYKAAVEIRDVERAGLDRWGNYEFVINGEVTSFLILEKDAKGAENIIKVLGSPSKALLPGKLSPFINSIFKSNIIR